MRPHLQKVRGLLQGMMLLQNGSRHQWVAGEALGFDPDHLQAAPRGIDPERVKAAMLELAGVESLHGLHIWSVSSSEIFLSCHLRVGEEEDRDRVIQNVNRLLAERFGIEHTALQIEGGDICGRPGEEKCWC